MVEFASDGQVVPYRHSVMVEVTADGEEITRECGVNEKDMEYMTTTFREEVLKHFVKILEINTSDCL